MPARSFLALRIVAALLKAGALLLALATVFFALATVVGGEWLGRSFGFGNHGAVALGVAVVQVLVGFIGVILMFATAEMIGVGLAIEENTRVAAQRLGAYGAPMPAQPAGLQQAWPMPPPNPAPMGYWPARAPDHQAPVAQPLAPSPQQSGPADPVAEAVPRGHSPSG